jgi:hypothetical protein
VSAEVSINVGDKIINCVKAIDKSKGSYGGSAKITNGGIGYNHVKVKITSEFSRGFTFAIEVYGQ